MTARPAGLKGITDEALAAHARGGDSSAFAELAARYRPLIQSATMRYPRLGATREDLRQEALIGLYRACQDHGPGRGPFRGYAKAGVYRHLLHAFQLAAAGKHRLLSDSVRLEQPIPQQHGGTIELHERIPGPVSADPAVIVPLRLELQRLAADPAVRAFTASNAKRKRFTYAQVSTALELVGSGQSLTAAGKAVGATSVTVAYWCDQAGMDRPATRRNDHTPEQVATALRLLEEGATVVAAGKAVGASDTTVARWRKQAREQAPLRRAA
jgi:DNA-directed RNA polymerase specialized sigma24 family protein